jgi:L-ribulose-5-phosphate 3-epimerase
VLTRRTCIRTIGQAALSVPLLTHTGVQSTGTVDAGRSGRRRTFCLFSKHLPELSWGDLGRAVKEAGFDGVDLTVRAGGHVAPERAAVDLPRAVDAVHSAGLDIPMISTDLTSADTPVARPLLETAAASGIRYFKTGYWRFTSSPDVREQVAAAGAALGGLAALARDCGIELGFHNHQAYIGAALWDIAPAIDTLDPRWAGYYFDPRHAVAEGGGGAWKAAARLVAPRLKMVAVKDCVWVKSDAGWRIDNCPLGEGLVDWAWFSSVLRDAQFGGPISVHLEYELPAGTRYTLEAAARDLAVARRFLS